MDWLARLVERDDDRLTPHQAEALKSAVRQNGQAPDELRPLLERHVRLLRPEALALPEEPADRSAMTRRARREVAGLLATEGYFSPRVRFDRSDARDWLLEVEPGPRTEIAQVELQFVGEIATSGPGGSE